MDDQRKAIGIASKKLAHCAPDLQIEQNQNEECKDLIQQRILQNNS